MKKIFLFFILLISLNIFSTSNNAYEDAQRAASMDETLNMIENENLKASEENMANSGGNISAGGIGATIGTNLVLGHTLMSVGNIGNQGVKSAVTDTGSTPSDWSIRKSKLKPWEYVLIGIFVARELREVVDSNDNKGNTQVLSPGTATTPIINIKETFDPRAKIILLIFRVLSLLSDKIGKTLARATGLFLVMMGILELVFIIFRNVTNPNEQENKSIMNTLKELFPHMMFIGMLSAAISSGLLWNFYTGPLFNFSVTVGSILSGQKVSMYNLPDFLTKLFNAPFVVIFAGFKMMANPKYWINSYMPILVIVSGLMLLFLSLKAGIGITMILVDYILVGIFGTVIISFMALGITKNIGSGVIGGFMAAMVNVMVVFALFGLIESLVDNLDKQVDTSPGRLLATICLLYIVSVITGVAKNIGNSIHHGQTAFVSGTAVTSEIVKAGFQLVSLAGIGMGFANAGTNILSKQLGEEAIKGKTQAEVSKMVKENFTLGQRMGAGFSGVMQGMKGGDVKPLIDVIEKTKSFGSDMKDWQKITQQVVSGEYNGNFLPENQDQKPQIAKILAADREEENRRKQGTESRNQPLSGYKDPNRTAGSGTKTLQGTQTPEPSYNKDLDNNITAAATQGYEAASHDIPSSGVQNAVENMTESVGYSDAIEQGESEGKKKI